jgi:hypothetical protein
MYLALISCTIIFIGAVLFILSREKLSLYHPIFIFILWHFMFYVLVPWQIWYNNDWSYLEMVGVPYDNDFYIVKTLLLVHLGFIAVLLGFYSNIGLKWASKLRLPPRIIQPQVVLMLSFIFLVFGAYGILTYHPIIGLENQFANPMSKNEIGGTIFTGGSAYVYSSYHFISGVSLICFFLIRTQGLLWKLYTGAIIIGYLMFTITRGWHRAGWVLLLLGLVTIWLIQQSRRWPSLWWLLAALPLVVIFNINAVDRDAWFNILERGYSIEKYAKEAENRMSEGRATTTDTGNYQFNIFQVMLYPEKIPYELGRNYINGWIISLLPRLVFPDKDKYMIHTNIGRTDYIYHTAGPTTGIYIDFYCNGGIPGIVVGCLLLGIMLRTIWQILLIYLQNDSNYIYIGLLYAGFITFYPQLLRDGIGSLVLGYFYIMAPILLSILISRETRIINNHYLKNKYLANN